MKTSPDATQISVSSFSNSLNSDKSMKYAGLVHRSTYKRLRDDLVNLTNYMYSVTPRYALVHVIITFFRIMQLVGPSMFASNDLWSVDHTLDITLSVISVFYHVIPPELRGSCEIYVLIGYIGLFMLQLLITMVSSFYLKKYAKLPAIASNTIVIFYATCNFVLHPIALHYAFEVLAKMIFFDDHTINEFATYIILLVVLAVFFLYLWTLVGINTQTLSFRTISCMSVTIAPQNMLFVATIVVNALMGLAAHCTSIWQIIFLVFSSIAYFGIVVIPFYQGGFVNIAISCLVCSASITGGIMCLALVFFEALGQDVSFAVLIIFILGFAVITILFRILFLKRGIKNIYLLDRFMENNDILLFKSPNSVLNAAVDGFRIGHPIVINGQIFKAAIEQWPKNTKIWYVFAKFVAIYPEDTTTLAWIFHSVTQSKLKGSVARTIKEQSLTISRQRESQLSPGLKTKLNNINKHIQGTKHKLRHVWDLVIQGNIGEMEQAIKRVNLFLNKNDADFKHLFRQFPNNRFVTRNYARFCKELLANNSDYLEYMEKSRLLQRGITVNDDQTHILGLIAFPMLPSKIQDKIDQNQTLSSEMSKSMEGFTEDEETLSADESNVSTLRQSIEKLRIPAITKTRIMRVAMLSLLYLLAMIIMFVYSASFIKNLSAPLPHMESITRIRTKNFHITTTLTHYIYEQLGIYNPIIPQKVPPSSLGSSFNSSIELEYMLSRTTIYLQQLQDFNSYEDSDPNIAEAKDLIFGTTLNYTYFSSLEKHQNTNQTIRTGMVDMLAQAQELLSMPSFSSDVINTSIILNPTNNCEEIGLVINNVMELFINYITNNDVRINKVTLIGMIVVIVFYVVSFLAALIYQLKIIQSNKEEAYKALTSIPKNAVSLQVENLRVLKSEGDNDSSTTNDTETSKQEENIIKIFMTGDESSAKMGDRVLIIIGTFVTIILAVISTVLFCNLLTYESRRLLIASPHLNYLTGSYCQYLAAMYLLQLLALRYDDNPLKIHMFTIEEMESRFDDRIKLGRDYYHAGRFGGVSLDESPFLGYQEGLDYAYTFTDCKDPEEAPKSFMEMITCYNVEGLNILVEATLTRLMARKRSGKVLNYTDPYFDYVWSIYISPIYDGLIFPMSNSIVGTIEKELATKRDADYPILAVLLVISIVFEVFVFIQLHNIESHIRFTVALLIHFPPSIVMSTRKAAQLISGDFSTAKNDNTRRKAEFYDQLFKSLPSAVVITDSNTNTIEQVNKSCERMLFMTEEELIGNNLKTIFEDKNKFVHGEVTKLFRNSSDTKVENLQERDPEGSIVNIEVSASVISNKAIFTIIDMTDTVRYNKLISDERAKSDSLLDSILPASLVKRVQAGEKNISFAVQSATILFLDIVSFTPWCGSTEANKVMSTLNLMFKKLDHSLSTYPTMTKIKCIGDCYMAAGGIFSEVNQPAEHAKEVVSFGLDALDNLVELNTELGEKLQIRVGVNTGGPIVAGVLGIGKPTFEILGPAINMAQQMEHHGVPMRVHISRPVYELIYGDMFKIQERGTIEVKNGNVVTYLVIGKK